jgi:hypothetical protein
MRGIRKIGIAFKKTEPVYQNNSTPYSASERRRIRLFVQFSGYSIDPDFFYLVLVTISISVEWN